MSTLGQKPSQQDATVQNQQNEPQETADLLRSESILGILNCTTSRSTTTLAACARMVPRALPTFLNVESENTDVSRHKQKTWCFQMLQPKEEFFDIVQHRSPHDAKTRPQSLHVQGRQRCLVCWQRESPGQRFRIPHWKVHTHGFAEEFLICIRDLSLLSFRDITWKRNGSKSIGKEFFKGTLKVGTSGHIQLNRTAETCTSNIVRKLTNRKTDLCTPHCRH